MARDKERKKTALTMQRGHESDDVKHRFADRERHTHMRKTEAGDAIRMGLQLVADHAELSGAGVRFDLEKVELTREELGAVMTMVQFFGRQPQSGIVGRSRAKGHREQLVSVTASLAGLLKACGEHEVDLPEKIKEAAETAGLTGPLGRT